MSTSSFAIGTRATLFVSFQFAATSQNPSPVPTHEIVGWIVNAPAGGLGDLAANPGTDSPMAASPTRIKATQRRRSVVVRNRFAFARVTVAPGPNGAGSRLKNNIRALPPRSRTVD